MNLHKLQNDPAAFRDALWIDTDKGPEQLAKRLDDWQRADFDAIDNCWRRVVGQDVEGDCYGRAWIERPRGHSKSSDVMTMATWALFASQKQITGVVVAVDREQAGIDRDHVGKLLSLNNWLGDMVEVQNWRIRNPHTGSTIELMSSDIASSYGLLIDFAICDEVTLWPKRELFDSILSAAAKRSTCLLLCIGNAGFEDSWQSEIRKTIHNDERWYFSRCEGSKASWISEETLAEQERLLPRTAYERLWLNIWSPGAGDAISASDLAAAFKSDLQPLKQAEQGWTYVCGVDAGISRDASAVCVLGVRSGYEDHGQIRLARTKVWKPTKDKKVDLGLVEA